MTQTLSSQRSIRLPVFFAFFAPPIVWTLHLLICFPLVNLVCRIGTPLPLYIVTIVALLLSILAGLVAYGSLRAVQGQDHDQNALWQRREFLRTGGVLFSILFSLPIVLWGFAAVVLNPC